MKKTVSAGVCLVSAALSIAAGTPRETLDKKRFANKIWDAIPMLLEERREEPAMTGSLDDMLGGGSGEKITLEGNKPAYDSTIPPKGEWGQCPEIGARTLRNVSRTSNKIVRYPLVGDFLKEGSRSTWYRNEMLVPATWKGRQVRVYAWLWGVDALVYVNGRKAGRILRPLDEIDVTDLVEAGKTCTVEVLLSTDKIRDPAQAKWFSERYWKHWLVQRFEFRCYDGNAFLTDVFANASVRKNKVTMETEVSCRNPGDYRLQATFTDAEGGIAKTLDVPVALRKGLHILKPEISWPDAHLWELRQPYLYKCEVTLCDKAGEPLDRYPAFRFGFREVYRVGKQLYMNGHPICLRGVITGHSRADQLLARAMGFNVIPFLHNTESYTDSYQGTLDVSDDVGMGVIANGPNVSEIGWPLVADPVCQEEYRRQMRITCRSSRNHPSMLAHHVSCNYWNPRYNQFPWALARDHAFDADGKPRKTGQEQVLDMAATIGREFNPNVLFYGHADGNGGDISGANLYLNWTPMQEREDWFSDWAENGTYPYQAAEYGEPYWACWWAGTGCFEPVEHAARYFGDESYRSETQRGLELYYFADHIGWGDTTGGARRPEIREEERINAISAELKPSCPAFWKYRALLAERSNRAFRTDGVSGGIFYFNLNENYGVPPGRKRTSEATDEDFPPVGKRPPWASVAFDVQAGGNQDLLGYIGGRPRHTDKTHAYVSGEKVEKQLVTLWDNPVPEVYAITWECREKTNPRNVYAGGKAEAKLGAGERQFDTFSFIAPDVKKKTDAEIRARWVNAVGKTMAEDGFALEFYPPFPLSSISQSDVPPVALFDPKGGSGPLLKRIGIPYRLIGSLKNSAKERRLVVGLDALDGHDLALRPADLDAGVRVLILVQNQRAWNGFGFRSESTMSRLAFKRDKFAPAFQDVANDQLAYWRGKPTCYDAWAFQHMHRERGPRWSKTHTVSGYALSIPEWSGWRAYLDMEFDLNYSPFFAYQTGAGGLYFSTFDFDCNLDDPAAMQVAKAVFDEFLNGEVKLTRPVVASGPAARSYAERIHAVDAKSPVDCSVAGPAVLLVGPDSPMKWGELKALVESGANALVYANETLAGDMGLVFRKKPKIAEARYDWEVGPLPRPSNWLFHVPEGTDRVFRGVGPSLLRWRYGIDRRLVETAPPPFRLDAGGYAAIAVLGKGKLVYVIEDPVEGESEKWPTTATAKTSQRNNRKFALFLANLGAKPSDFSTRLALYQHPLRSELVPEGADERGMVALQGGSFSFTVECENPCAVTGNFGADAAFTVRKGDDVLLAASRQTCRAAWPVRLQLEKGKNIFTVESAEGTTAWIRYEAEPPLNSMRRTDNLGELKATLKYAPCNPNPYFFHYW